MEIVIVRGDPKPWGIDGCLKINKVYICDTLEHPTRHLPAGSYVIGTSPFRHGDGAMALKTGEILVGKRLMPGVVTESQQTYDRLYERLRKAFRRGTPVRLTICG